MTEAFFAKDSWKTDVVKLNGKYVSEQLALLAMGDRLDGQHDPLPAARLLYR